MLAVDIRRAEVGWQHHVQPLTRCHKVAGLSLRALSIQVQDTIRKAARGVDNDCGRDGRCLAYTNRV